MSRVTDTRVRVHEIASRLHLQGKTPTVALVRSILGKGSPNTIVEELKAWRGSQPQAAAQPVGLGGFAESQLPRSTPAAPSTLPSGIDWELLNKLEHTQSELAEGLSFFRDALGAVSELAKVLKEERDLVNKSLSQAQDRFDGLQRHMLMSIDSAREETRIWRERAKQAQGEVETWRFTMASKIEGLNAQIHHLKGQISVLEKKQPTVPLQRGME